MKARQETAPPGFLRLAGNPLRWRLLSELARSDRQVRELTVLLGQPQNLVSYHLGRLRAGGLAASRRSSADGRDAYYSIDLARCGELLIAAGAALHPGLRMFPPPPARARAQARVLFLCTGNSTRSQMAQAIMEQLGGETVAAASAGSHPKPVHPNTIAVMREQGIDISGRHGKHMDVFAAQRFDYVISLCDRVREVCPEFSGPPEAVHWSIPDPAAGEGSETGMYPAFRAVAADLRTRIGFLLARINDAADRAQEVDSLCQIAATIWSASATWSTTCRRPSIFYTGHFGFAVGMAAVPAFAEVTRGHLRLLLAGPASSAGRPMPDGRIPGPGGWNRIHFVVSDLAAEVDRLRASGVRFRNDVVTGPGGQQILLEDPSGNPVELFQPAGG